MSKNFPIMKRFFFLVAIMSTMLVACDKSDETTTPDEPTPTPTPTPEQPWTPTEGITTESYYGGEDETEGVANCWINFVSDDYEMDDWGDVLSGYVLIVDFNTTVAENPDFATLAEGTYLSGDSGELFTVSGATKTACVDGQTVETKYAGAVIEVARQNDLYKIDCTFTTEEGTEEEFSYIGDVTFINRTGEGQMSNLTGDVTVGELTQGYFGLFGESMFEDADSDMAMMVLAGDDFDLEVFYGNADSVCLYFNIPVGAEEIPDGTYQVLATDATDIPAGTMVPGMKEGLTIYGTWFFSTERKLEVSVRGGSVTVSHTGNMFDVKLDLLDGYGNKISGSYKGELEDYS